MTSDRATQMKPVTHARSSGRLPIRVRGRSHTAIVLAPEPGTETFGRSGFMIHGDNIKAPGTASEGCIIQVRAIREAFWNSGDREIEVTL